MQEKFSQIYDLYNAWKYKEAKLIVDKILLSDPKNIYAKRYLSLLEEAMKKPKHGWKFTKIARIKWKKLSCPHCSSKISLSALSQEQREKVRSKGYKKLSIKCPYCNTIFSLYLNRISSFLWIKIWDKLNYNKKNYRVVWAVKYVWKWYEGVYSWYLNYLEWILLWTDNSYLYFSEWYFLDDSEKKEEFEFSEKITPDFNFKVDYEAGFIEINSKKIKFSETNKVKAEKLYWENSKVFKVWEKVELFEFSYKWQDYVLEKEKAWRQAEAWIYKTKSVSERKAANYFSKDLEKVRYTLDVELEELLSYTIVGLIIFVFMMPWLSETSTWSEVFKYFLILAFFYYWYLIYFSLHSTKIKKFFTLFIAWPVLAIFIVYPISNFIIDEKKEIKLKDISTWEKFETNFTDKILADEKVVNTQKYDYWGVKTTYRKNTWLKFSVKDENDKKIIEKIKNLSDENNKIYKIFKEKIYKLK